VFAAPLALIVFGAASILIAGMAATIFGMLGLILLLIVATALHGTLAADRPAAANLTEFYLWMAAGGVVGGLFPALIAPQLFDWVYEHPILLLAAALLVPAKPLHPAIGALWRGKGPLPRALRILAPVLGWGLAWWLGAVFVAQETPPLQIAALLLLAGLALVAIGRPLIFTWLLAMLMLALGGWQQIDISSIDKARQRSFFGIYTIENSQSTATRRLLHGTTLHGAQSLDPARSRDPLTYYAPKSGVGLAMQAAPAGARIGVVGLGTGSLTCYADPSQDWTVFEIDPLMVELATDPAVFSYVSQCAPDARIVIGDARLKLAEEPAGRFDLLAVDAFSSDAIPLHLLTREAFDTYVRTLAPDGLLLVHISNRFLDLEPVVAAIAAETGLKARILTYQPSTEERFDSYNSSIWIVLARREARIEQFVGETPPGTAWQPLRRDAGVPAWTDSFASILPVLKPIWQDF
jgi:hypothetical protein